MGGNVAENLSNQSVPEAAARVAAVVNRLVNRIGSNAESRERLAEIEIPEELRDNLALFLRLERRVLSEYDPEIADLFDKILTAEFVANAGNPGSRAADESVDEQGVPTADEPTAVAFREVVDLIDSLPLDKQQVIVRAFTSFFHLANLSEENYRVAQLREREAGRIRNLGWSFHGDQKVFDHLLAMHDSGEARWDFVQIQMNYVDWKHASDRNVNAEYLYGELEKRGIPAVIMEPLLGGRLSRLNDHLVERLKERRPTESTASWAFRYAGSWPGVLTVLSGMTYMEHLQDNIRTYSPLEPCTGEELALLEDTAQLMLKYPTVPCTECQYCMPCPYGLDIPAIFAHYNRCVNEGNVPKDRQDPGYREARRAFLIGYDRSVPKLRQASHCIGCNQCVSHCPQSIKIPQQLRRIDRFVEQLKQGTL